MIKDYQAFNSLFAVDSKSCFIRLPDCLLEKGTQVKTHSAPLIESKRERRWWMARGSFFHRRTKSSVSSDRHCARDFRYRLWASRLQNTKVAKRSYNWLPFDVNTDQNLRLLHSNYHTSIMGSRANQSVHTFAFHRIFFYLLLQMNILFQVISWNEIKTCLVICTWNVINVKTKMRLRIIFDKKTWEATSLYCPAMWAV